MAATPAVAVRRSGRARTLALFVVGVGILLTVVAAHTLLAQNQVRLDRLEGRIAAEEQRYDSLRLANGQLSSPARITARAAALGLTVPVVPPVAVAVVGEVPRRGSTGSNLAGWAEVKGHLAAAP